MQNWLLALGLATTVALPGGSALAADHRDGAAVLADPATDINDVYTWVSADGMKVYLAMTVFPAASMGARFSDQAVYTFHTTSRQTFVSTDLAAFDISCTFDASTAQRITCWIPQTTGAPLVMGGDASVTTGITGADGKVKLYAGLRKDHFFFNLDGFNNVRTTVKNAVAMGSLTLNADGCRTLPVATLTAVSGLLSRNGQGMTPATDFFLPLNTLAIVMEVDKTLLSTKGNFVSVWAATRKK